jgi:hypothetical protein
MSAYDPKRTLNTLFDHLVGAAKQRERDGEAECLGGFKVDVQLDLGGLLDWQVRRLLALEYAAGINTSQAVGIYATSNPGTFAPRLRRDILARLG